MRPMVPFTRWHGLARRARRCVCASSPRALSARSRRTDYLVSGRDGCTLFLTAAKVNSREGRLLGVRPTDAGKTWRFVAWIDRRTEGLCHHALDRASRRKRVADGHSSTR